ncbi:tetratricopeptide repeat protein [Microbulbifer sp. ARAS458-1]|uniref:tetratricopeptide repeat protein n=1 Tax=Microbulbifer sp. ARAS458-1 TaxID=3140242 RepID=UPI003877F4B0
MQHRDSDPKDPSFIQPADFSFGGEGDTASGDANTNRLKSSRSNDSRKSKVNWLPIALGTGMLGALVGVFWVLPQMVDTPAPPVIISTAATDSSKQAQPKIQESPYTEAEIMQQRRDVQKILQDILQLQEELLERRVETWAAEEYFAARALAEGADTIYRQRKFMQALEQYREALAGMQALRDSIPERIEQHLASGHAALDTGDQDAANKSFDLVLTISEDHPRGMNGKNRAQKLHEVWPHVTAGKDAFTENNLDTAKAELEKALTLDGDTVPAKALLPEVNAAILERDYSEAMSAGYAAIGNGDFEEAKSRFSAAKKLKPNATDPDAGLRQAANGAAQGRIDRLFASASKHERKEQWHKAVEQYSALLETDSSLVEAATGKARSQARAKLDDQLQELLQDPLKLSQSKRNQYARKVLADARALKAGTPRLTAQVEALETALTQALIPVTVVLQSDASTQVTIYHVGKLGNFSQRQIALKPGRYTAVGTRQGYRDVRQEFVVQPQSESPVVTIQCAEKINSANNS